MRHAVLVLAILASLPILGVGVFMAVKAPEVYERNVRELADKQRKIDKNELMVGQYEADLNNSTIQLQYHSMREFPFFLGSAFLAIFAGIVAETRRGLTAMFLLVAAMAGPAIADGNLFVYFMVAPFALPAFLAIFVRNPTAAQLERAARRTRREDDLDDRRGRRGRDRDDDDRRPRDRDDRDDDDRRPRDRDDRDDERGRSNEDDLDDRPRRGSRRPSR